VCLQAAAATTADSHLDVCSVDEAATAVLQHRTVCILQVMLLLAVCKLHVKHCCVLAYASLYNGLAVLGYSLLVVICAGSKASRQNVTSMVESCMMGLLAVALTVAAIDTMPCAATPVAVICIGVVPASICDCWIGCVKVHSTEAPGTSAVAVQAAAAGLVVDVVLVKATRVLPVLVKLKPSVHVMMSAAAEDKQARVNHLAH
jgi:hypothetical protein